MKGVPTQFSKRLEDFLCTFAPDSLGASPNTLSSYCTTFRRFLSFAEVKNGISADKFELKDFSADSIDNFLNWLESDCHCKTVTRNQRLSALHSFCRYLMRKEPAFMNQWQTIINIKEKKHPVKKIVDYLTIEETSSVLHAVDISTKRGRRDEMLLCFMYDTASRVQEIADVRIGNLKLYSHNTSFIYLTGKGNKTRSVPLSTRTFSMLKEYVAEQNLTNPMDHVFTNNRGEQLSRHGIAFILKKYVAIASDNCPSIRNKTISPHTMRHSKAMHLLQGGIDLIKIRDLLGHESVTTTEIYARTNDIDLRAAVDSTNAASNPEIPSWHKEVGIMERLASYARKR